jgi:hypothetical protein
LLSGLARAEETAKPPAPDSAAPFQLADLTGDRLFRGGLVYTHAWDKGDEGSIEVFALRLGLQLAVARVVVVYGLLPLAYVRGDGDEQFDPGNLTVGGRWVHHQPGLHAGAGAAIGLPTSPDFNLFGGDSGAAAYVATIIQFDRSADFYPNVTSYQLAGDVRVERGDVFCQVEVGYLHLTHPDADEGLDLVHADIGAGVRVSPTTSLLAELTTISLVLEDEGFYNNQNWFHSLYAGARHSTDRASIGAYVFFPFDGPYSDEVNAVGVGVDVAAPL